MAAPDRAVGIRDGPRDCRWIYRLRTERSRSRRSYPATNPPCSGASPSRAKPVVSSSSVISSLASRSLQGAGRTEIDARRKSFVFRPDPDGLWGRRYPEAAYRLVTSTPEQIEAVGGDELLYADGKRRSGAYAAIRTRATNGFVFAVVGSMTDAKRAEALAAKYAGYVDPRHAGSIRPRLAQDDAGRSDQERKGRRQGHRYGLPVADARRDDPPHRAAWPRAIFGRRMGHARRVPGPAGAALSLEHDGPAKAILRTVFAQQYEKRGDWPQWFMLEPYTAIQDKRRMGTSSSGR